MAEPEFYNLILNEDRLKAFLEEKGLVLVASNIQDPCRNPSYPRPDAPWIESKRQRNLNPDKANKLSREGQNIDYIACFRHKGCYGRCSPRSNGFLTYVDSSNRSNTKLAHQNFYKSFGIGLMKDQLSKVQMPLASKKILSGIGFLFVGKLFLRCFLIEHLLEAVQSIRITIQYAWSRLTNLF